MNLATFLMQRIAEDEAVARDWPEDVVPRGAMDTNGHPIWGARSRVLAECAFKRQIVEWYASVSEHVGGAPALEPRRNELGMVLRALAEVYADHPDYDEAWRP